MGIAIRVQPTAGGVTRCAWCHGVATRGRVCRSCNTRLHDDCADQAGVCPTLGCTARISRRRPRIERSRGWWVHRALDRRRARRAADRPAEVVPLTGGETLWALVLGIALPIACLLGDPIVFQGRHAMFPGLVPFVYPLLALQMVLLPFGLLAEWTDQVNDAFIGGALSVGALSAFGVGVILLPLTAVGLLLGIGILGLIPFFTGRVYRRVAQRCLHRAGQGSLAIALLGASLALLLPLFCALAWG